MLISFVFPVLAFKKHSWNLLWFFGVLLIVGLIVFLSAKICLPWEEVKGDTRFFGERCIMCKDPLWWQSLFHPSWWE